MSRWLKTLLLGLVVAVAGLFSLPWWLGVALRPALKPVDVTFERYERVGYARFRLHGVRYANTNLALHAAQVEAPTPLAWLGQRLRGAEPLLTATGWQVQRVSDRKESAGKQNGGLPALRSALERIVPRLGYWLPRAQLQAGEVHGFGPDITVEQIDWRDFKLQADGLRVAGRELSFVLVPDDDGSVLLTAHTLDNAARLQLAWSGAEIKGTASLWEQPAQLSARFPDLGWLPAEASIVAENWNLPAARVKLGVPYARVLGGARALWRDGAFDLTLEARAEPEADTKTKAPPFAARIAARGTLRELTVTALTVDAPFATAQLTAPVTFSPDRPEAGVAAKLNVLVDLAKQPWIEARGKAEGTVTVTGSAAAVRQEFALEFTDVVLPMLALKKARARGQFQWPQLELNTLAVQLDDTSTLEGHGGVNWQTRELSDVALTAKLGPAWFAQWLPDGAHWENAELSVTAEGPLAAARHRGSLKLGTARWPGLHAMDLDATWQGEGTAMEISAAAKAGHSSLELAGAFHPRGGRLTKLQFAPNDQVAMNLSAPAELAWSPTWRVAPLRLTGPASQIVFQGHGGADGAFELTGANFDSAWLHDWMPLAGPHWRLHSLRATGRFDRGVLAFATEAGAQIEMSPRPAEVRLVAGGDAQGVQLKELTVTESGRPLTQATGRLPLTWTSGPGPRLQLDEDAPLELSASTDPDSPLWAALAAFTGVQLIQPAAKIDLKGTVRQPRGEIQIQAGRMSVDAARFKHPLPELADLSLSATLDRTAITLAHLSGKADGQAVQASGRVPMEDGDWQRLWKQPAAFDWSRAEARVEIPDADLAPLARRFPEFVAAQGRLRAFVDLKPGGKFSGELHLADAATRPLAPLGTLHDIQAELLLDDRTITVRTLTAVLGGEPVSVGGSVALVPAAPPRLDLTLKGKNLPVVRNTGLLLRTDLDLSAKTDRSGVTHLGGAVTVRDCLLLASLNLRTLLPTGVRGITRQPPYFSVEAAPFSHWPLAVDLRADKSVRLRTPVFNGTASARFRLVGTLGEPHAIGELTMNEGRVLFPFATFKVQTGRVRLRESDPFHATVALTATAARRDYQLRLEATGELPSPNILLTSSPSLEADEVLLLVMTGQAPGEAAASGGKQLALLGAYLSRGLFQDLGVGGGDRLEISSGAQVSEQGRDTYEFEYKLGERTALVGEYDRFDSYNAGLKWRVFTQESLPLEKK